VGDEYAVCVVPVGTIQYMVLEEHAGSGRFFFALVGLYGECQLLSGLYLIISFRRDGVVVDSKYVPVNDISHLLKHGRCFRFLSLPVYIMSVTSKKPSPAEFTIFYSYQDCFLRRSLLSRSWVCSDL